MHVLQPVFQMRQFLLSSKGSCYVTFLTYKVKFCFQYNSVFVSAKLLIKKFHQDLHLIRDQPEYNMIKTNFTIMKSTQSKR